MHQFCERLCCSLAEPEITVEIVRKSPTKCKFIGNFQIWSDIWTQFWTRQKKSTENIHEFSPKYFDLRSLLYYPYQLQIGILKLNCLTNVQHSFNTL